MLDRKTNVYRATPKSPQWCHHLCTLHCHQSREPELSRWAETGGVDAVVWTPSAASWKPRRPSKLVALDSCRLLHACEERYKNPTRCYVSLGRNRGLSRRGASSSYSTALCLHALNTGLYSLGPCLLSSPGFYASRRLARFHPPRDAGFWHRTLCCCSTLSPRWNGSAVAAVH